MTDTSVYPPADSGVEGDAYAALLREQVKTLAGQVDGFREQLKDLFDQLGVVTYVDAEIVIEIMQQDIASARELAHVYTRDPQDSASIVAALLVLVDTVSG